MYLIIWPWKLFYARLVFLILTLSYTLISSDSQAHMVWFFFLFIDFPVSLLYTFAQSFSMMRDIPVFGWFLYPPYIIHGILGTIWWYFVARFITSLVDKKSKKGSKEF